MINRPTDRIQDEDVRLAIDYILQEGLGNAIELAAVPTATEPLLQANEWGYYSGVLYFRMGQTIFVITPSSTITVT